MKMLYKMGKTRICRRLGRRNGEARFIADGWTDARTLGRTHAGKTRGKTEREKIGVSCALTSKLNSTVAKTSRDL